jgi:hypothetical protein
MTPSFVVRAMKVPGKLIMLCESALVGFLPQRNPYPTAAAWTFARVAWTVANFPLLPFRRGAKTRSPIKNVLLSCLPLLLAGTALGGEGVEVKITNDGTEDVVVTVYDMNTHPKKVVLTNARINGFTSVPISLIGDANGMGNVSWTATSTDPNFKKCGHATMTVSNAGSVSVHADSTCSA